MLQNDIPACCFLMLLFLNWTSLKEMIPFLFHKSLQLIRFLD